jgi:Ca2+-binding RTX toxin-like protein
MTTFAGAAARPLDRDQRLTGGKGDDTLAGGAGADTLSGGLGSDSVVGGGGDDLVTWKAGDGNDVIDGGLGVDTFRLDGSDGDETFLVFERAVDRIGQFIGDHLLIENIERIEVRAGGGNDGLAASNVDDKVLVVDMGAGNDTVIGSRGADTISGGTGDDLIQWRLHAGSDKDIGGNGVDTLDFDTLSGDPAAPNGSDVITLAAQGDHARLSYDLDGTTQDLTGIERVSIAPREGGDVVIIHDLSATDVKEVVVELGIPVPLIPAATTIDFAPDAVEVFGKAAGGNQIEVVFEAGVGFAVQGLSAKVLLLHADGNSVVRDSLFLFGGTGVDTISAAHIGSELAISFEGGAGADSLAGGGGSDIFAGRDGADTLSGGPGGDDTFAFFAGETGSDRVLDFTPHPLLSLHGDTIFLGGYADTSLAELLNRQHIFQSGADVVITDGVHTIVTLANISLSDLHSSDFQSSASPTLPGGGFII